MPKCPPRISVIVPCFNLGAYLDEAVASALEQDYEDVEIVVVNDGSTDPETNRLLADYRRPKTRVIQSANLGPAGARNLAIEHSTGEYLCALDADDKLAPGYFAKAAALLEADPEIAFVSSWVQMFGAEDTLWKQERCDLATLLAECTVSTAALVRRSAVLDVGGFDVDLPHIGYEDWDLWISIVEKGYRGIILPEPFLLYRRRPGSVSAHALAGETQITLWRALVAKHRASYERHIREVLLHKEREVGAWLRDGRALEAQIDQELAPLLAAREAELARLREKLDAAERVAELEAALVWSRRTIEGVLRSNSWRLTAPLRRARELFRQLTGYDERRGSA